MRSAYPFSTSKSGIATIVIAVVIVIIIAVASVGAYFLLTQTSPTTSNTQTSSTSKTTTSSVIHTTASSIQSSSSTTAKTSSSSSVSLSSSATSSTAATSSTISCSTTFTSATTTGQATLPNFSNLLGNFSAMTVEYISGGQNSTGSYNVVSSNSTTYEVNVTISGLSGTIWFLKDGTVAQVSSSGQVYTGSMAQSFATGLMSPFLIVVEENAQIAGLTSSSFVHSTGQTSVTLGSTQMTVTNYTAINTPYTYSYCGISETISSILISVGTPPATNFNIITYMSISGSSGGNSFSFVIKVLSITVA